MLSTQLGLSDCTGENKLSLFFFSEPLTAKQMQKNALMKVPLILQIYENDLVGVQFVIQVRLSSFSHGVFIMFTCRFVQTPLWQLKQSFEKSK